MRRLTLSLSVIAMIAALLPVVARVATAQAAGSAPQISVPAGKTAVRQSDELAVSGDATGAANGAVSATLIGLAADGTVLFEEPNVPGVSVSNGQYTGSVFLGCGFGEPGSSRCPEINPDPDVLVAGAALRLPGTERSNVVRVDYTDPEILRYELIDARHVRVVFSEPVRMPPNTVGYRVEAPSDWAVDGEKATAVADPKDATCQYPDAGMTTGCTRVLELSAGNAQTEDATPYSQYQPDVVGRLSPVYQDYANNSLAIVAAENSNALDRIRPAAPNIQTIDRKVPVAGAFISNNTSPIVRVTNLRSVPAANAEQAHTLEVRLQRDGGTVRKVRQLIAPESNVADVTLPTMSLDTGYTVTAIAIDAAGNRSDDDSKTGPAERADGARPMARYTLDRLVPEVLTAGLTDNLTVAVEFTEPVLPANDAGEWFVGDIPVTASGSGDARTLKAQVSLANPGRLRWKPTSTEAGSVGAYGDLAGNAMPALTGLTLSDLPPLTAPKVTSPTSTTYTDAQQITIRGTAGSKPDLLAELFTRGSETVASSAPVTDGRWSITQALAKDARYEYEVRIRNTKTGVITQRVRVADIVRDQSAPVVNVTAPASGMLPLLDDGTEYDIGDAVKVEWTATDTAAADSKLPDHGRTARVVLVAGEARRAVSPALEHQPGQRQTFTYTLTEQDLAGESFVDLQFEVVVDDLARNLGSDTSDEIRLLGNRVGYRPVLTDIAPADSASVIEAQFPGQLTGSIAPGDWKVNGAAASAQLSGDTVLLTVPLADDPNATPRVQYTPTLPEEQQLKVGNRLVTRNPRTTIDRVKPALTTKAPATGPYTDARTVAFTGTTDVTTRRNTIAAYKATATGARTGPAIAKAVSNVDGTWKLNVPLNPNRRNTIVVQAVDPSANRSELSVPYSVVEDSVSPVVRVLSPRRGAMTAKVMRIEWRTVEAHKRDARIQYRVRRGEWKTIVASTADDGYYRWTLPKALHARIFEVRVRAYDRVGRQGARSVEGLRADLVRPVLYRARTLSPTKVRLFFSERVNMTTEGFTVDGIRARRVNSDGSRQTLILRRSLGRTAPQVVYNGNRARDMVGNRLADRKLIAERAFVFSVTGLDADRLSGRRVRLDWRDARNREAHIRHYRIIRDGRRIGTVGAAADSFTDTNASGGHRYVVKAVDYQGRVSTGKAVRVSR